MHLGKPALALMSAGSTLDRRDPWCCAARGVVGWRAFGIRYDWAYRCVLYTVVIRGFIGDNFSSLKPQ